MSFNPEHDIPDLSGRIILITGGNTGLGKETGLALAQHHPAKIYLACRSASKAAEAITDIMSRCPSAAVEFLELDLASLASVRNAAAEFATRSERLDLLINNAGVMAMPPGQTVDGNEMQMGVNHLGHFLLTILLLPVLQRTASVPADDGTKPDVRVVNLSSAAYKGLLPADGIHFDDLNLGGGMLNAWRRYGQSKLANVLFTRELARRYPDITSIAAHPGTINTALWNHNWFARLQTRLVGWIWTSVEVGSHNTLWASTSSDVKSGDFYFPVGVLEQGTALSRDPVLAKRLWEWSDDRVGNLSNAPKSS